MKEITRKHFLKASSLAASSLMLNNSIFSVFADTTIEYPDEVLKESEYADIISEYQEEGLSLIRQRSYQFISGVTHFYQSNSSWSNELMQSAGLRISTYGCCLVSFAMLQNYFDGSGNPSTVNATMGSHACFGNYGFQHTTAAARYGYLITLVAENNAGYNSYASVLATTIRSGQMGLVRLTKISTGETHFVLAVGFSNSTIYILDPASRNYSTINQYYAAGWHVTKIIVYQN